MSFLIPADDVPTATLKRIIAERELQVKKGRCPYCLRSLTTHTCKYSLRPGQEEADKKRANAWHPMYPE